MVEEILVSNVVTICKDEEATSTNRGTCFAGLRTQTIRHPSSLTNKDGVESTFNVALLGDTLVGKTSLARRVCGQPFLAFMPGTIGADLKTKTFQVGDGEVKLQIWDISGHMPFPWFLAVCCQRADALVFVFDVTCKASFDHVQNWMDKVRSLTDASIPKLIVGNKCDLHAAREVETSEALAFANHRGMILRETSSKSDLEVETVDMIFQSLAETLKRLKILCPSSPYITVAPYRQTTTSRSVSVCP